MSSTIKAISFYLPENTLTNEDLSQIYDGWSSAKIEKKTGIRTRHISSLNETALDLGYKAAIKLFDQHMINPSEVDFVLFCTESPDYPLPPNACILQNMLNIPTNSGALDFNLGCSGFVYGLGLAHSLIASQQAKHVLLITSETYSKYIDPNDKSVRTIFGDGAAATLIVKSDNNKIGPFVYGTDGSGYHNLIVPKSNVLTDNHIRSIHKYKISNLNEHLFMNGPEIFNFTINTVPKAIFELLKKSSLKIEEIDLFIFHQANKYMLDHLREKIGIDKSKFYIDLSETANTVSASIPIALSTAINNNIITFNDKILLIGFGVGYSWAGTILEL